MRQSILLVLVGLIGLSSTGFTEDKDPKFLPFFDIYGEGVRLSRSQTEAGLIQGRYGLAWFKPKLETYAVARAGADVRTFLDSTNAIYNDNFLFLGAGTDYLGLLPGVRLTLQLGGSIDLNAKIKRGGFDMRTGFQTYHELNYPLGFFNEFYNEFLYVHRYRDAFLGAQVRFGHRTAQFKIHQTEFEIDPLVTGQFEADTTGLDYNRYVEATAGLRFVARVPGWASLAIRPYYVWGARWERPTDLPNYQEFRLLLTFYLAH